MDLKQIKQAIKDNGGATLTSDLNEATLKNGYMVSLKDHELKISIEALSNELLKDYQQIAKHHGAYVGLWLDNNDLYLDISINIKDHQQALKLAHDNKQLAIYHIEKGVTVYV